ncbi:hypothetical protein ANO11243_017470 [Dothideomycetidae sp. 11243]|nr:hypothetical protein ANO11243_017470 [fungal sp. No.11243]
MRKWFYFLATISLVHHVIDILSPDVTTIYPQSSIQQPHILSVPMPPASRRLLLLASSTGLAASSATYLYLNQSHSRRRRTFHPSLDKHEFTAWTVARKQVLSDSNSILTLVPPVPARNDQGKQEEEEGVLDKLWKRGTWSVQVKNGSLMVGREYTPLPPALLHGASSTLVRATGETSRLLHNLAEGAQIELRGPETGMKLPETVEEVLFLAGGTGVAPALQIAHTSLLRGRQRLGTTRMTLLWANRQRQDCHGGNTHASLLQSQSFWSKTWPFTQPSPSLSRARDEEAHSIVQQITSYGPAIRTAYFVDNEGSYVTPDYLRTVLTRLESECSQQQRLLQKEKEKEATKLLVVSGPPGFVEYFAGPKTWTDGRERQGPLGGILGRLKDEGMLEGWKVYKL